MQVSGTVTDAGDGQPLTGVNIVVKGTTIGTSTDIDGNYELNVPSAQDTLVASFIGYISQQIPVNGRNTINIDLQSDVQQFEDVVVVGYGTQEKQQITGSVSSVKSEDFVTGNVNSAGELIQGKVPGLTIASSGGDPNSSPTIRLRGISSFASAQEPLVVVDGIIGASLDNLDPNDIASIDVLKDASASAIYGTRGAAGVIVVTTKSGGGSGPGATQTQVNYNGSVSMVGVANRLDVLSGQQFRALSEETGTAINDLGANTDWFEEITQTGYNHIHNLALSGGDANTNYRISGNFRDNTGIQRQTGFNQINGRINLNQRALDDKLSLTLNLASTNREEQRGFDSAFRYAATFNPTAPVMSDGFENTGGFTEIASFDVFNPVAIIETAEHDATEKRFNGALRADYEFEDLVPGLSASAFYSLETETEEVNLFYAQTNKFTGGATKSSLGPGLAQRFINSDESELFEATVSYNTDISDLRLETIAGYSYNDFLETGTSAQGGDFISDAVGFNNLGFAQDFSQGEGTVGSYKNTHKIIGFFGRANLNWDDTYFLNASVRREGSSRFGENEKFGTFWSTGGGVELTNIFEIDFMSQLKARASYGVTGNDAPFSGISKLRFAPGGNFFVGGNFVQSFGPVSNPNPDLKWEENHEYTVGLDFSMFNSRLNGTVEYYEKTTKDLLFEVQVPVPPNLYPTRWENVGELENNGFDASLDYAFIQSNEMNWNSGFTFSTFNTVLSRFVSGDEIFIANAGSPGQNSTPLIRVKEGEPLGQIWGPEFAGIGDDGEWRFFDADGNRVKIDEITRDDEKVIGNGLPDFSIGWTNNFNYKNWDVSTFIRGVFGHDQVNTFSLFYEVPSSISTWNVLESAQQISNLTSPPTFSSFNVEDASFVRFQNASIGYTVPLPENSQISRLRLSVSGNNLLTLTGYDGIDPEVSFEDDVDPNNPNPLAPGIERRNNWFTARSFTFGVNLEF
ncbi:SusC/RagA family TonB-linked outer membrane protein [Aliifodinibius sp. S!AR15-10]|uniref:SusC/RagA family TonB-linked outer membrane protein n=1 Tax=Aliifodinibius sp. S!AR15-10 TaxID=2950437 RepID=UPI002855CC5D|nr:SusC/RagA family TonB-linked outer membrane protein [Aliifodinibius sp. S!AR15-10]MDR8392515.1 SusC/RagA family TonB-linked outer membrane protein [Aliifodinibius sp. S!AR15-10]